MDKPEFVPSCGTCRYRSDGPHVNADRGTAEFPDTMFACKRRAPVVTGGMMSNTMTIWPMVTKTDYCGEYESSEAWAAAQSQPAAEPVGDEGLVELIARAICRNSADEIVQGGDVVGQPVDMPAWMLYQPEARRVAAALSTPAAEPVDVRGMEEAAARAIYERPNFGNWTPDGPKPAWVPNGNSIMQDLARNFALAAISAIRIPAREVPDESVPLGATPAPEVQSVREINDKMFEVFGNAVGWQSGKAAALDVLCAALSALRTQQRFVPVDDGEVMRLLIAKGWRPLDRQEILSAFEGLTICKPGDGK